VKLKKVSLNRIRPAQPPQQRCQPKHELATDSRFRVIVGDDCLLKGLVVISVFEGANNSLSRQPMSDRIELSSLLAFVRSWAGATQRIAPIGLEALQRDHGIVPSGLVISDHDCSPASGDASASGFCSIEPDAICSSV
jgi:hypothetical protein